MCGERERERCGPTTIFSARASHLLPARRRRRRRQRHITATAVKSEIGACPISLSLSFPSLCHRCWSQPLVTLSTVTTLKTCFWVKEGNRPWDPVLSLSAPAPAAAARLVAAVAAVSRLLLSAGAAAAHTLSSRYQAQSQSGGIRKEEEDLERVGRKEGRKEGRAGGRRGGGERGSRNDRQRDFHNASSTHARARRCILPSSKPHYFMTAESISDCEANKKPSELSFPSNIRMEMMGFAMK